jgi:hypothetical protein
MSSKFVKRYSHSIFMNWFDETLLRLKNTRSSDFSFEIPNLDDLISSYDYNQPIHNGSFKLKHETSILHDLTSNKIELYRKQTSYDEWSYNRYRVVNILHIDDPTYNRNLMCLILSPIHNHTYTNLTFIMIDVNRQHTQSNLMNVLHLYLDTVLYVCTDRNNVSFVMIENDIYVGYTKCSLTDNENIEQTPNIRQIIDQMETEINTHRFQFNELPIDSEMLLYGTVLIYVLNITYIHWIFVHLSMLKWTKTNKMIDFDEYKDYDFSYQDAINVFSYDTYVKSRALSYDIHRNKELENEIRPIFERMYDDDAQTYRFPYMFDNLKTRMTGQTEQKINKTIKINMLNKHTANDFMYEQFELSPKELHIHIQSIVHSPHSLNTLVQSKDKMLQLVGVRIVKRMLYKTELLLDDNVKLKPRHIGNVVHKFTNEMRYVVKYIKSFIDKRQELTHIISKFNKFQMSDEIAQKSRDAIVQYYIFYYVMVKYTFEYSWKYKENGSAIRYVLENNNDFWKLLNSYKYLRIDQTQYTELDNYCRICDIVDTYDLDNYMNSTYGLLDKIKSYISIDIDLSNLIPTIYPYSVEYDGLYNKMVSIYSMITCIQQHPDNPVLNIEYYKQINGFMLNVNKELKKYELINDEVVKYNCQLFVSQYIKLDKLLKVMYDRELIRDMTQIMNNMVTDEERTFHYFMKNRYDITTLKGTFNQLLVAGMKTE